MIELKNVNIELKKDGRSVTEDFSFTLRAKEKAVIIGEEGNGKSTLLKYVYNRELIEGYCSCSGQVIVRGKMAYLPQCMGEKELRLSLAEYFENTAYYGYMDLLPRFGLSAEMLFSDRKLSTLSGGERVKVQLARLLMEEPDILLLDEPTNDLDIPTLQWLETFLAESRKTILYVSHDESLIEKTATVILHMEQILRRTKCRITVARCPYAEYLSRRQAGFDHQEQVAKKQREDYARQMERWRRIYDRVDHEQETISRQDPGGARLLKKKMHAVLSMKERFERDRQDFEEFPQEEEAILARFDPSVSLPPGKTVLDLSLKELRGGDRILARDLKLFVAGNEHVGIVGRNGAGKSTLLHLLWEQIKRRGDITPAFMPQDYSQALDFQKTPLEHLADRYTKEEATRARTYMGGMRFTREEMQRPLGSLSGGQQAKILFLDMILRKADVLLMDEPTRNFSPLSGPVIRASLRDFGGCIISVSHDRKYLQEVCGRVLELREDGLQLVSGKGE